ncbi:hypothetical protein JCM9534A_05520 [Catenuloplanes indicus JCM 9534]
MRHILRDGGLVRLGGGRLIRKRYGSGATRDRGPAASGARPHARCRERLGVAAGADLAAGGHRRPGVSKIRCRAHAVTGPIRGRGDPTGGRHRAGAVASSSRRLI